MEATIIGIAAWAILPGSIARKKGRSFWAYYFLSFLISPLITTIIVVLLSNISNEPELYSEPPRPSSNDFVELCENCGADISNDLNQCHICGHKKTIAPSSDDQ